MLKIDRGSGPCWGDHAVPTGSMRKRLCFFGSCTTIGTLPLAKTTVASSTSACQYPHAHFQPLLPALSALALTWPLVVLQQVDLVTFVHPERAVFTPLKPWVGLPEHLGHLLATELATKVAEDKLPLLPRLVQKLLKKPPTRSEPVAGENVAVAEKGTMVSSLRRLVQRSKKRVLQFLLQCSEALALKPAFFGKLIGIIATYPLAFLTVNTVRSACFLIPSKLAVTSIPSKQLYTGLAATLLLVVLHDVCSERVALKLQTLREPTFAGPHSESAKRRNAKKRKLYVLNSPRGEKETLKTKVVSAGRALLAFSCHFDPLFVALVTTTLLRPLQCVVQLQRLSVLAVNDNARGNSPVLPSFSSYPVGVNSISSVSRMIKSRNALSTVGSARLLYQYGLRSFFSGLVETLMQVTATYFLLMAWERLSRPSSASLLEVETGIDRSSSPSSPAASIASEKVAVEGRPNGGDKDRKKKKSKQNADWIYLNEGVAREKKKGAHKKKGNNQSK